MSAPGRQQDAAAPVRAALVGRASERAGQVVAEARAAAQALVEQAAREADAAVARARADGAAQAVPVAAAELGQGRRAARAVTLRAELHAHDEVTARITAAVLGLRDDPGYPELRERLAGLARRSAGPGAQVSEHASGGVVARSAGVVVDCSLPRLADRAVAALGERIAALGRPGAAESGSGRPADGELGSGRSADGGPGSGRPGAERP